MSIVSIGGTLILKGNLTCTGTISVENTGILIPISNAVTDPVFSCPVQDFVSPNGKAPYVTSLTSDIDIRGLVDGIGYGFPANEGPGANSTLPDTYGRPTRFYGATHAGIGYAKNIPEDIHLYEEEFVLNSVQTSERRIILTGYPVDPNNVTLNIIKGTSQQLYTDFTVTGNILSWNASPIEPIIDVRDRVRVTYLGDFGRTFPPAKSPYGSYEAPISIGSGSGEARGGSGIKLIAQSGTVTVNGSILMNGQDGISPRSGGASGGSVWITAYEITGSTGVIMANGGDASYEYAGGGGGGYIALHYEASNTYSGSFSVIGRRYGTNGILFIKKIEPFFIEKFTGHILNTKWWSIKEEPVVLDNDVEMITPIGDVRDSRLESHFNVSGKNIIVDVDYIPQGSEPSYHTSYFQLAIDNENWVGVARKFENMFGIYSVDGYPSQTGIPYAYVPVRMRVVKSDSTFTFQFIDSSTVPQTIFSEVLPQFANKSFYVRLGIDKDPVDTSHRVDYFSLTYQDIINKYVTLSSRPMDATDVAMNILNSSAQYYGLDYYVDGQKLKWDARSLPLFEPTNMLVTEDITLTPTDILLKRVKLSMEPTLPNIALSIVRGGPQDYGLDFYVINDYVYWNGKRLESYLTAGDIFHLEYLWSVHNTPKLETLFQDGDQLSAQYMTHVIYNDLSTTWDNLRVYSGILGNYETREPLVYVDPVHGSDSSSGLALTPLQNLFVATAWAKRGGTVVLYDGTYNPTEIINKNLTIMGANGAFPIITTANVLDSTGSNWENSGLTLRDCQGLVNNVHIHQAVEGICATNTHNLEIRDCVISDATTGIHAGIYTDGIKILRNTIHDVDCGINLETQVRFPYIYSNVIYNSDASAIALNDASNFVITSNTMDRAPVGITLDNTSTGVIASNNITNMVTGVQLDPDSSAIVDTNNFYGTSIETNGGTIIDYTGNSWINPQYVDDPAGDYHIMSSSPNRSAGNDQYDNFYMDRDGATKYSTTYDLGAFDFVDGSHGTGPYYVSSTGDDYRNFGTQAHPYRTLDKAMSLADAAVNVDAGHLDSYYLSLKSQNIYLNTLTVYTASSSVIASYVTLTPQDASNKYISLPGFNIGGELDNLKNVAMNILRGPAQEMGVDYTVGYGSISWSGFRLDGKLSSGDVLRLLYPLQTKAASVMTLNSHFSNIDLGNTLFVSPNGSDSTYFGGDGTHSGGNGSVQYPYRTVTRALLDSSTGCNIIVQAGEYEIFNGRDDRVIYPKADRTSVTDGRYVLESLFQTPWTAFTNHTIDDPQWATYSTFSSESYIQEGFLTLAYDGTHACEADSTFTVGSPFEIQATLRQAYDPIFFKIHNTDNTAIFKYNNGNWTSTLYTGDQTYSNWGNLTVNPPEDDDFFTDYVCVSSENIANKYMPLTYLIADASLVTLSIVGGSAQHLGEDFYVDNGIIKWDGLGLDGNIQAGEVVRVIYRAHGLSDPIQVSFTLDPTGTMTVQSYSNYIWTPMMRRRLLYDSSSTWSVSFFMDQTSGALDYDHVYSRGYVSRFMAIGSEILNSEQSRPYQMKTWRQPVAVFNPSPWNP